MDIYQNYRQSRNMINKYSGFSESSVLENYVLFRFWQRGNSQRVILNPAAYDKAIDNAAQAAAAKVIKKIQDCFR